MYVFGTMNSYEQVENYKEDMHTKAKPDVTKLTKPHNVHFHQYKYKHTNTSDKLTSTHGPKIMNKQQDGKHNPIMALFKHDEFQQKD